MDFKKKLSGAYKWTKKRIETAPERRLKRIEKKTKYEQSRLELEKLRTERTKYKTEATAARYKVGMQREKLMAQRKKNMPSMSGMGSPFSMTPFTPIPTMKPKQPTKKKEQKKGKTIIVDGKKYTLA